ncbi:nucleoside deaminase [bacterium]|nr:nucleoside deaminase [bacterium]
MEKTDRDLKFLNIALQEAGKAFLKEEVPVGAIIVRGDEVIARAHNIKESSQVATDHAEIRVIRMACKKLKSWRLTDCEIYVNLEPCLMCAGAIMHARFKRLVFSLEQDKTGAFGSLFDIRSLKLNHSIEVSKGLLKDKSLQLMQNFFTQLRRDG